MLNTNGEDFTWSKWEFQITALQGKRRLIGHGHSIKMKQDHYFEIPGNMNELQVKNEVLDGLFQDHLLGFWFWDLEHKNNQLSASLYSLLGYETDDIETRKKQLKWEKHIHLPDKAKVEKQLKDHFFAKGKIPFHCEFRILSLKNEIKYVVCYGKVVKWAETGSPCVMVGGLFDISEKKKSEAIIEKQDQFLRELTFNQSHLMRAKLANILGVLEVMDGKRDFEETAALIGLIKNEAIKLDQVLQSSIHASSALNSDNF
ncbi:PAS domain-containing protein [Mongoliibacter ruber]|nr:PAS domain-containing protein [Mongoliibacter ruber]